MKRFYGVIFLLLSSLLIAPFTYAYECDWHPYHHRHYRYHGGYVFCPTCGLYHYPSHHHFRHVIVEPTVVEHGRTIEHEVVTQTDEVVE